jgi:hypothetical protein
MLPEFINAIIWLVAMVLVLEDPTRLRPRAPAGWKGSN